MYLKQVIIYDPIPFMKQCTSKHPPSPYNLYQWIRACIQPKYSKLIHKIDTSVDNNIFNNFNTQRQWLTFSSILPLSPPSPQGKKRNLYFITTMYVKVCSVLFISYGSCSCPFCITRILFVVFIKHDIKKILFVTEICSLAYVYA